MKGIRFSTFSSSGLINSIGKLSSIDCKSNHSIINYIDYEDNILLDESVHSYVEIN